MKSKTSALTPECTIVYPELFEPTSFKDGPEAYRAVFLIEKDADISEINAAIRAAADRKFPGQGRESLKNLRMPIREGSEKAIDENGKPDPFNFYYNRIFISAKSKYEPDVVDIYGDAITDPAKVYGGCRVRAYLNFFGYEYMGNKGVSASLQAVVKIDDGDPIGGGKPDPRNVFAGILLERKTVFDKGTYEMEDDIPY